MVLKGELMLPLLVSEPLGETNQLVDNSSRLSNGSTVGGRHEAAPWATASRIRALRLLANTTVGSTTRPRPFPTGEQKGMRHSFCSGSTASGGNSGFYRTRLRAAVSERDVAWWVGGQVRSRQPRSTCSLCGTVGATESCWTAGVPPRIFGAACSDSRYCF